MQVPGHFFSEHVHFPLWQVLNVSKKKKVNTVQFEYCEKNMSYISHTVYYSTSIN